MTVLRRTFAFLALAGLIPLLHPSSGTAQVLRGVVVDEETRSALPASLVVLVDSAGRDRQRFLTDSGGAFRFTLPRPGVYGLRVERLGAETGRLDGIPLGPGDTLTVRVPLATRPVALEGIEVPGEARCELAGDAAGATQEVWEAARKALATANLTDSLEVYRYELVRYRRVLDPRSLTVRDATESRRSTWTRHPVVSRPVDVLADSGFVVLDPREGDRYYAPDAQVLLSDRFLDTHCFGLRSGSGDESGLVGLEFEPLRSGSDVPDIEGVLWLDRDDGGLRRLDFHYTNLPGALAELWTDDVGGRVEFRGLPDGNWIVSRWFVRMPVAEEVREPLVGRRVRLRALAEEGGRVAQVRRPGGPALAFAEDAGTIAGSVEGPGTPGLGMGDSVAVIATGARAPVDAGGRFRIDGVAAGRYELAWVRPELMGLDASVPVADVTVPAGDTAHVAVEPPPVGHVLAAACGASAWDPEAAVLLGEVVDGETGVAATGAEVRVTWQTVDIVLDELRAEERARATRTDDGGAFRVCAVPRGTTLTVTADLGGDASWERTVVIEGDRPVASVILDGSAPPATVVAAGPAPEEEGRRAGDSTGRFVGRVVDAEGGEPLAGASVRLPDLSLGVATDDGGRFELLAVPAGRHRVEVAHLGYATARDTVAFEAGRTSDARVRLALDPVDVEPIEVVVERREVALETAGFYERREEGWGRFIDLEEIERRNPSETTDLFTRMTGLTFVPDCVNELERYVILRGGMAGGCYHSPGLCFPTVLVDGTVVHRSGTEPARIDQLISSHAIAGIEVYPSSIGVPVQYSGTGSSCGVVLIWTRR